MRQHLIPFFVVDRPISLEILRDVMLKYPSIEIGLMTHAFTSNNFIRKFNEFLKDRMCESREDELPRNLIKMADSGVFNKNGCHLTYDELFRRYEMLGVEYGIIIDVLKDSRKTIESAFKGLRIYERNEKKYNFKLVAVAQGKDLDGYLKCYEKLQEHFEYIAVGGLLKKIENSARYVRVRDESFMYDVLRTIKRDYSPDWLFALGCYHPSRHKNFEEIGVWGSDYKGWIFNYTSRLDVLVRLNKELRAHELNNGADKNFKKVLNKAEKIHQNIEKLKKIWKNEQDTKKKRKYHSEIKKEINKLKDIMSELGYRRRKNIHGSSREYTELVLKYIYILGYDDRTWRFREVQKYVEREVYGRITTSSGSMR